MTNINDIFRSNFDWSVINGNDVGAYHLYDYVSDTITDPSNVAIDLKIVQCKFDSMPNFETSDVSYNNGSVVAGIISAIQGFVNHQHNIHFHTAVPTVYPTASGQANSVTIAANSGPAEISDYSTNHFLEVSQNTVFSKNPYFMQILNCLIIPVISKIQECRTENDLDLAVQTIKNYYKTKFIRKNSMAHPNHLDTFSWTKEIKDINQIKVFYDMFHAMLNHCIIYSVWNKEYFDQNIKDSKVLYCSRLDVIPLLMLGDHADFSEFSAMIVQNTSSDNILGDSEIQSIAGDGIVKKLKSGRYIIEFKEEKSLEVAKNLYFLTLPPDKPQYQNDFIKIGYLRKKFKEWGVL